MEPLIIRLLDLAARRSRFTYDLRGNCLVYTGIVAAYAATQQSNSPADLVRVLQHALAHDGIVGSWKRPDGTIQYDSCRLFTDLPNALRFAGEQGQQSVYNLNREEEVQVKPQHDTPPAEKAA